jgi:hypothetical protein
LNEADCRYVDREKAAESIPGIFTRITKLRLLISDKLGIARPSWFRCHNIVMAAKG